MASADEMTVTLPAALARLVRAEVAGGAYASGADVVRDALRERYLAKQRDALERALDIGIADLDAGRSLPLDAAFAKVRKALAQD